MKHGRKHCTGGINRTSPFKENIPYGISGGSINQDTSETQHTGCKEKNGPPYS